MFERYGDKKLRIALSVVKIIGHFLITGESLSDFQYEVKQLLRSRV